MHFKQLVAARPALLAAGTDAIVGASYEDTGIESCGSTMPAELPAGTRSVDATGAFTVHAKNFQVVALTPGYVMTIPATDFNFDLLLADKSHIRGGYGAFVTPLGHATESEPAADRFKLPLAASTPSADHAGSCAVHTLHADVDRAHFLVVDAVAGAMSSVDLKGAQSVTLTASGGDFFLGARKLSIEPGQAFFIRGMSPANLTVSQRGAGPIAVTGWVSSLRINGEEQLAYRWGFLGDFAKSVIVPSIVALITILLSIYVKRLTSRD